MRRIKLTKYEQQIEDEIEKYVPVGKAEFNRLKAILERRKKNAVLNIRVNNGDLENIKRKAKKLGVKYQTFISEFLHRLASS